MGRKKYPPYIYLWVIKSKAPMLYLFGPLTSCYFEDRKGIKKHYCWTNSMWRAKYFSTRDNAEKYYYKKLNAGFKDIHKFKVTRKKIWLSKDGSMDFWKNEP